ncbi:lambda exonuclease family protein [Stenotrophomonas maltophilia]|uniref:Recombinase n=1 Tax=Stenotrophomonas maltophilia TaxID=40324 RepID=A0A4V3RJA5_STEMA|nr:lambda exonuclease family protein [Stenotrophomonas maltophilia]TGY35220.1 recombinase [Stenotrophomonas maltophilia]
MIVIGCDQGSEAWHRARAGIITASMFATARSRVGELTEQQRAYVDAVLSGLAEKTAMERAGYKAVPRSAIIEKAIAGEPIGDFSEASKNYAFRLAIERISGEPLDEGFETFAMRRGHELEPFARAEHEVQTGLLVKRAGFVLSDCGNYGCSADGFIGDAGGSEYKAFINPEKLRTFHLDNDASEVFEQAQGCMWITGRQWWHIGLYCPALEPAGKQLWWRRFERDEAFIAAMRDDLERFRLMVDGYEAKLREPMQEAA